MNITMNIKDLKERVCTEIPCLKTELNGNTLCLNYVPENRDPKGEYKPLEIYPLILGQLITGETQESLTTKIYILMDTYNRKREMMKKAINDLNTPNRRKIRNRLSEYEGVMDKLIQFLKNIPGYHIEEENEINIILREEAT